MSIDITYHIPIFNDVRNELKMNERTKKIICIIVIGVAVTSGVTLVALTLPAPEQPKLIHISLVEGDQSTIELYVETLFSAFFKRNMPYKTDDSEINFYFEEIEYVNGIEHSSLSKEYSITITSLQLNNNTATLNLSDHIVLVELR